MIINIDKKLYRISSAYNQRYIIKVLMTESKDLPSWLRYYHHQLDMRNQSQSQAFSELIKNYCDIMAKHNDLGEQLRNLKREKALSKQLT